MKYLFLSLLFGSLLWAACDKDTGPDCPKSYLPKMTTAGNNTVGFLLDGEPWSPYDLRPTYPDPLYLPIVRINHSEEHKSFSIQARRSIPESCGRSVQFFSLFVRSDSSLLPTYVDADFTDFYGEGLSIIDTTMIQEVHISRFDPDARILSGSFTFHLKHRESDAAKHITEGRFDFRY